MKKISELCGVSEATVSKALAGKQGVNLNTRNRIKSIAEQYNYHPNALVRGMQTGSTLTIGITYNNFGDSYAGGILNAIQKILHAKNYVSLIINWDLGVQSKRNFLDTFAERRVDGILMFPPAENPATYFGKIKAMHKPVVVIDQIWDGFDFEFVGSDDFNGGFVATEHLVQLGHKNIANIFMKDFQTGRDRLEGFRSAMAKYEVPVLSRFLVEISAEMNDVYDKIKKLLIVADRPSGIVCFNDNIAVSVLAIAHDLGIKVPEELSVVGFSDLPIASQVRPKLTTIKQDTQKIGYQATELLLERIMEKTLLKNENFAAKMIRIPVVLTKRDSTSPWKTKRRCTCVEL